MLRYVGETEATVWVETDAPCEVEVLGHADAHLPRRGPPLRAGLHRRPRARHHEPYEVHARRRAGLADARQRASRPRVIRTPTRTARRCELAFGSCRVASRTTPPYALRKDDDPRGREIDALRALAMRMRDAADPSDWPARAAAARRPGLRRRGLARDARRSSATRRDPSSRRARRSPTSRSTRTSTASRWSDPTIRWLLSTVSERDDLRRPRRPRRLEHVDQLGRARCARSRWWDERIVGGAHVATGSTSTSATCRRASSPRTSSTSAVREADGTPAPSLREFAAPRRPRDRRHAAGATAATSAARALIVIDSRAGRVLDARPAHDGRRRRVATGSRSTPPATSTT